MSIEVRKPVLDDALQIRSLLANDYGRLGIVLAELNRFVIQFIDPPQNRKNHVVTLGDGQLEAATSVGDWRADDAAPYTHGGLAIAKGMDEAGMFERVRGIHVLSARYYETGSAIDEMFDRLIDPTYSHRVPVMTKDLTSQALLRRHGFAPHNTRHVDDPTYGDMRLWARD